MIAYCLQVEPIFVLAVASKIRLSTAHSLTLCQGWHHSTYDKAVNCTNHIIEPGTTPCAKTRGNFLLLLFGWKIKFKLWGVVYDIDNTPYAVIHRLH